MGKGERADRSGPEIDVLIPALVDAHAHLELGPVAGGGEGMAFADWIRAVLAAGGCGDPDARARANLARACAAGAGSFGDIRTRSRGELGAPRVRGRGYRELIGFGLDSDEAGARVAEAEPGPGPLEPGLSPHAPYSTSAELFEACAGTGLPLAIHAAETPEEVRFLRDGTGPLRELLEELGKWRPGWTPPKVTPIAWLASLGCLGPQTLLVHAHHVAASDLDLLARARAPIVVCPGTLRWFGRGAPPVAEFAAAGLTVALGTDSLASNDELDLFGEMARLRAFCPGLAPSQVLRMATEAGGRALGIPGLGRLAPGLRFDAVVLEGAPRHDPESLDDWISAGRPRARELLLAGSAR